MNPGTNKFEYPVIPEGNSEDLHNLELLDQADLILFMAGNQFMLMPELIEQFQEEYPEVRNIVYQTLPPGLELKQILSGGARFCGKSYTILPDVYSSVSWEAMCRLEQEGYIDPKDYFVYLHNKLALIVRKKNPKGICRILDLGREDVVVSQPNLEYENIAEHIQAMYRKAGGEGFVHKLMQEKREQGTSILTTVHHRETPERLIKNEVDVGPVWNTEILAAQNRGLEIEAVEVQKELDQKEEINYYICSLNTGKNPQNANKFLQFIQSKKAGDIFQKYGFIKAGRTA